jgi:polyhydroxybutyrate depolymerase
MGGTTSMGGTVASGGSKGGGGVQGTGGGSTVVGSGGASTGGSNAGGSKATGGNAAGGGTGTSLGSGGGPGTGGLMALGGATGSGGSSADAGASTADGNKSDGDGTGGSGLGGAGSGGSGTGGSTGTGSCPTGSKPADATKDLTVDSIGRKYILHVPSAYTGTTPVPLVLDFHPIGGSASAWRTGSPYPAVIDKEGVISAFPDGLTGPMGQAWNVVGCCVSQVNGADVDDVAFAKAIVADIEKVACIDTKRIYAVGFSMGGGMSNWLACKAPDVFAAAGPASFDLTKQNQDQCTPSRPITVIEWRGKNDGVVAYAGGHSTLVSGMAIDFLGAVGTFQKWASIDGCTGNPSAEDSSGCQTYSQCSASVQVTLCTDANGGHEAANAGIVWPILKKYTLP